MAGNNEGITPKGFFKYYFVEITLKRFFDIKGTFTGKQLMLRALMLCFMLIPMMFITLFADKMINGSLYPWEVNKTPQYIFDTICYIEIASFIISFIGWLRNGISHTAIDYPTKHTAIDYIVWAVIILSFSMFNYL